FEVYGPLFEAFEAAGYRRGDLRNPRADADLYVFAYDWRDDAVAVAADLVEQLEGLRRARGEEVLEIDLLAQSGAARIARYAVRHGGASRAAAEIGLAGPADGWRVRHLIFV